eukprot:NODE_7310_length_448_cov_229.791349.p2 GENE.NODE_7310_length_448_cov_229.791349~~NODE_7310_length_448_cov_229.791349.p2  ORF type:complete len:96 (-),score=26.55 NODE_7310_length_448_cov_229.791349:143-430(-)
MGMKLNANKQPKGGRHVVKVSKVDSHTKIKKAAVAGPLGGAGKDIRKKASRGEMNLIAKATVEGHFTLDVLRANPQALAKFQKRKRPQNAQIGHK